GARMPGKEQHLASRYLEADFGQRRSPTRVLLADVVEAQDGHGREYRRTGLRRTGARCRVSAADGGAGDARAGTRSPLVLALRRARHQLAQACADAREQRSEEHTSELQSRENLVCRLLLEKKKKPIKRS